MKFLLIFLFYTKAEIVLHNNNSKIVSNYMLKRKKIIGGFKMDSPVSNYNTFIIIITYKGIYHKLYMSQ